MRVSPNNAETQWTSLEQLLSTVPSIPVGELPRLLGRLREVEATAIACLYAAPRANRATLEPDQLLAITEAARRLNVSEDYLYRNWKKLPFAHKFDWGLRFSARGIDEYILHKGMTVYTARNKRGGGSQ